VRREREARLLGWWDGEGGGRRERQRAAHDTRNTRKTPNTLNTHNSRTYVIPVFV
jgi:hypothetical protein